MATTLLKNHTTEDLEERIAQALARVASRPLRVRIDALEFRESLGFESVEITLVARDVIPDISNT